MRLIVGVRASDFVGKEFFYDYQGS